MRRENTPTTTVNLSQQLAQKDEERAEIQAAKDDKDNKKE